MKLALYQGPSPAGDVDHAFSVIETSVRRAVDAEADLLVFPELFLPGYNIEAGMQETAQPIDGPWIKTLSHVARGFRCSIVIGFAERERHYVYNSAAVLGSTGELLARYRKIQLYGAREKDLFRPGNVYASFDWNGLKVGLLICYDVEFPEHVRAMRRMGAGLVVVPTANMMPFTYVSRYLIPARACENAIAIGYANYCGTEGDVTYVGNSVIASADAATVHMAGSEEETLLVGDMLTLIGDPDLLSRQLEDLRAISIPMA